MNRRLFIRFGAAAVLTATARGETEAVPSAAARKPTPPANPFQQEGNWYKATLHVHTTTSDVDTATGGQVS
jgi:hypothetical protein